MTYGLVLHRSALKGGKGERGKGGNIRNAFHEFRERYIKTSNDVIIKPTSYTQKNS